MKKAASLAVLFLMAVMFAGSAFAGSDGELNNTYYGTHAGSSLDGTGFNNTFIGIGAGCSAKGALRGTVFNVAVDICRPSTAFGHLAGLALKEFNHCRQIKCGATLSEIYKHANPSAHPEFCA